MSLFLNSTQFFRVYPTENTRDHLVNGIKPKKETRFSFDGEEPSPEEQQKRLNERENPEM